MKTEIRGRLEGGMMAIGGETTGWVLRVEGSSKDAAHLVGGVVELEPVSGIESFDGKQVRASGSLRRKQGIMRDRWILSGAKLKAC